MFLSGGRLTRFLDFGANINIHIRVNLIKLFITLNPLSIRVLKVAFFFNSIHTKGQIMNVRINSLIFQGHVSRLI